MTAAVTASFACTAHAGDLGTLGPVYPIAEPHLLRSIEQRLRALEQSGELARLQDEAKRRVVSRIENPPPLPGIAPAEQARTFYFDPSVTLDRNVVDDKGNVLFPAGTRKNPLKIVSMSKHLIFFDASDARQVERARRLIDQYGGKVKPILVGGSYLDIMKVWRRTVYYDQGGALTKKLGITRVPALVSQEGMRLRIDELALL